MSSLVKKYVSAMATAPIINNAGTSIRAIVEATVLPASTTCGSAAM